MGGKAKVEKAEAENQADAAKLKKQEDENTKKSSEEATEKAKDAMEKAKGEQAKAVEKTAAALENEAKGKEAQTCACSGKADADGEGASCKKFKWRMPWCYVDADCKDNAASMKGNLKWLPGCHEMPGL